MLVRGKEQRLRVRMFPGVFRYRDFVRGKDLVLAVEFLGDRQPWGEEQRHTNHPRQHLGPPELGP